MKQVINTKQSNTVDVVLLYISLARKTTKDDISISKCTMDTHICDLRSCTKGSSGGV